MGAFRSPSRLLGPALALLAACAEPNLERHEFTGPAMGTEWRLVLYAGDPDLAQRAAAAAFARLEQLNSILSDYEPQSELSRLSARSTGEVPTAAVPLSPELWQVLERAQEISRQTAGAFDVTVGPCVRLWRRSRRQGELPRAEYLEAARRAVGFEQLELDPAARTARLLARDMSLDLGGIAKGYALDQLLLELRRFGIRSALVDGGGDVAVGEAPPGQSGWRVALADPSRANSQTGGVLVLANAAVATSGDAYQYVQIGGLRYSHIVDPATGLGLTVRRGAAVVAPDAMTADAAASALCVLGRAGLEWVEPLPGLEARLTELEGERLEVSETPGFATLAAPEPRD